MAKRKIIEIDRDLCDGCGLCTTACTEGALELDEENKAVLVRELFCDGMGACLDVCPTGALKIIERDSEEYDPKRTYKHVLKTRGQGRGRAGPRSRRKRPGIIIRSDGPGAGTASRPARAGEAGLRLSGKPGPGNQARSPAETAKVSGRSELTQWPIQLHLVSPFAPYFQNADLLIAADCTAFALGSFHQDLLKGKKLVIACPKLDDTADYVEKLAEIIKLNDLQSLTVAIMTVPCCSGLGPHGRRRGRSSGAAIVPQKVVIGIDGKILRHNTIPLHPKSSLRGIEGNGSRVSESNEASVQSLHGFGRAVEDPVEERA